VFIAVSSLQESQGVDIECHLSNRVFQYLEIQLFPEKLPGQGLECPQVPERGEITTLQLQP
jgi:hypothetical protein